MDNNMPRMSGQDAAREMRRWGYTRPVVGVTGDGDLSGFEAAGADEALHKPLSRAALEAVLLRHIRGAEASRF